MHTEAKTQNLTETKDKQTWRDDRLKGDKKGHYTER